MSEQLTRIERKLDNLHDVVVGDGKSVPLLQRVASLEEERGRRRWTMRLLIGAVVSLVGQWVYSLLHGKS